MTRRPVLGVLVALTVLAYLSTVVDTAAGWIHAHRHALGLCVFVGLVLFFALGTYFIVSLSERKPRSRGVSLRTPARRRSSPSRSGRPGQVLTRRRTRAAGVSARRSRPTSQGLGGKWL